MRVDVVFTGFFRVMGGVEVMAMRKVGMMRCRFMMAGLMVLGSFTMMPCCVFVVLGSSSMMVYSCVCAHTRSSFLNQDAVNTR